MRPGALRRAGACVVMQMQQLKITLAGRRVSLKSDDRNTRRRTKGAAERAGKIHPSATGQAGSQPLLPGSFDCSGRNGRFGQEHSTLFVEAVAGNRRIPASFHGMEFIAAGEIGDATRKTAAVADSNNVFATACGGFC